MADYTWKIRLQEAYRADCACQVINRLYTNVDDVAGVPAWITANLLNVQKIIARPKTGNCPPFVAVTDTNNRLFVWMTGLTSVRQAVALIYSGTANATATDFGRIGQVFYNNAGLVLDTLNTNGMLTGAYPRLYGHSMGGGIMTALMCRLISRGTYSSGHVQTFGAPKALYGDAVLSLREANVRCVNWQCDSDIIPHLPPAAHEDFTITTIAPNWLAGNAQLYRRTAIGVVLDSVGNVLSPDEALLPYASPVSELISEFQAGSGPALTGHTVPEYRRRIIECIQKKRTSLFNELRALLYNRRNVQALLDQGGSAYEYFNVGTNLIAEYNDRIEQINDDGIYITPPPALPVNQANTQQYPPFPAMPQVAPPPTIPPEPAAPYDWYTGVLQQYWILRDAPPEEWGYQFGQAQSGGFVPPLIYPPKQLPTFPPPTGVGTNRRTTGVGYINPNQLCKVKVISPGNYIVVWQDTTIAQSNNKSYCMTMAKHVNKMCKTFQKTPLVVYQAAFIEAFGSFSQSAVNDSATFIPVLDIE